MIFAASASIGAAHAADDVGTLNKQVVQLLDQGKYKEALPLTEKAVTLAESALGKEHSETLTSVNNLAELYKAQSHYQEAEPLYLRALEAFERVFGKRRHPAALNIGACFSYALAMATDHPLIFQGSDFAKTDVRAAMPSEGGAS